jgi:hypothetical protein
MIKTFRGILNDGAENKIRLSTKKGKIGYQIKKFTIIGDAPVTENQESVVKVTKVSTSSPDGTVDLSDGNLLAVAVWSSHSNAHTYPEDVTVIFDQETFNQDLYISHFEGAAARRCNYYLEIDSFTMTDNAASVSTLRDIRLNPQVPG